MVTQVLFMHVNSRAFWRTLQAITCTFLLSLVLYNSLYPFYSFFFLNHILYIEGRLYNPWHLVIQFLYIDDIKNEKAWVQNYTISNRIFRFGRLLWSVWWRNLATSILDPLSSTWHVTCQCIFLTFVNDLTGLSRGINSYTRMSHKIPSVWTPYLNVANPLPLL